MPYNSAATRTKCSDSMVGRCPPSVSSLHQVSGARAAQFTGVQTAADVPPVEATNSKMVPPLLRMNPDTLHLQAGSGRRSGQSRASVSACHAQALVCEG